MDIKLPFAVEKILKQYWDNGYEAYIVGGCVRDFFLGKVPKDYDITTNALPEETKELFCDCVVLETGLQHGTVTLRYEQVSYEVTTYRVDGNYLDHRRPTQVYFTKSLSEDLKRRDFTINAMAYYHELVDCFGGMRDLEKRVIRCVGRPECRFEEDGLRILRALRFAAILDFTIEPETKRAIELKCGLLQTIAKERIRSEWDKLLEGDAAERILNQFENVIAVFIPGFRPCRFPENVRDGISRLAIVLHESFGGDTETGIQVLKHLKYDSKTIDAVRWLLTFMQTPFETDKSHIKQYLRRAGMEIVKKAALINRADIEKKLEEIIDNRECYTLDGLALNGEDLMKDGMQQGKEIGDMLQKLLDYVIAHPSENTPESLKKYIERL